MDGARFSTTAGNATHLWPGIQGGLFTQVLAVYDHDQDSSDKLKAEAGRTLSSGAEFRGHLRLHDGALHRRHLRPWRPLPQPST